jgi:hypothetical protein
MNGGIDNSFGFLTYCLKKYQILWHIACDTMHGNKCQCAGYVLIRILFLLVFFDAVCVPSPESPAMPNPDLSDVEKQFGIFYSLSASHGEWIEVESGARVRRPYLVGRWVWTDEYGWYWMSDEPFGWIIYYNGRWYYDKEYGWVWLPDDVRAPARVKWRYDDDYIGWAPLPPYASFTMTFGVRWTNHWLAPAQYWNIVHYDRFAGTEVREIHEQSGERMTRLKNNRRMEIYRPAQDEMQRGTERFDARRGKRNHSIAANSVALPRVESRTRQLQDRQLQQDRNEMRRALKQRHERTLRPSPPAFRKDHHKRIKRNRENARILQSRRPAQERRSVKE